MTKAKREHLVLVGPLGKQAGLKDQKQIALQIYCIELNSSCSGGGISTLLLPSNIREKKRIENLLGRGYAVKNVATRRSQRKVIRNAVSDSLLVALAEEFLLEKGISPRAKAAPVREFSNWISKQLQSNQPNHVQSLLAKANPYLVDRTSSDWWKKQLAQRKK